MYIIFWYGTIPSLDDEIYRKKLEQKRDEYMKKERAIHTFQPVFSTKPGMQEYWYRRATQRLSISSAKLSESEQSSKNNFGNQALPTSGLKLWSGNSMAGASSITNGSDMAPSESSSITGDQSSRMMHTTLTKSFEEPSYSASFNSRLSFTKPGC